MRLDKLTTKFQEALADAQSLAVTRDNPYIEPAHLLAAMLAQPDGPKAMLDRAGVPAPAARMLCARLQGPADAPSLIVESGELPTDWSRPLGAAALLALVYGGARVSRG